MGTEHEHRAEDPPDVGRRDRTRVYTGLDARVEADGLVVRGRVRDLSTAGVYVWCVAPSLPGATCLVTIVLNGADPPVMVELIGKVARVDEEGIGVEFSDIPDASVDHLQRLVLYNASDPDEIEREFQNRREDHPPPFDPLG